jgi:PAS domain S-box-containing protein
MRRIPKSSRLHQLLLIEDEPVVAQWVADLLAEFPGSHFLLAGHAESLQGGLARLKAAQFDMILLDLNLPDSGGIETFLRVHGEAPHVPIIVLSAIDDEELATKVVHLGAQEYLVKTRLDSQTLQRALRYAIERFHAEAELANERDLLQTLLENIPDRIYFKDKQSRFTRINQALKQLFHLSRVEEAYGKTDADFYGEEHALPALEDERHVMHSGEAIINKIEREVSLEGTVSWSLTTKLPLRDRAGRIVGTCGISRDISDLKQMQEQLWQERNLLRSVIDNLPDHIFLKDVEGRYLLDNAAHQRWLGFTEVDQVIGKTVYDFFPEHLARQLSADDADVLASGQPLVNHEEKLVAPSGEERWVVTSKVPWYGEGTEPLGLVCIARDVTDQKEAEANLRKVNAELRHSREKTLVAMQRLQVAHEELRSVQLQLIEAEKMKSIGRLAAGIAHEVKNPLAILRMAIDYLGTVKMKDEHAPVVLGEMADAVQRADVVVRGLLDFSAPTQLELSPMDLNAIIESALTMVKGEMIGEFTVHRELAQGLPPLPIDGAKISQVFVNLLTNALHSMHGKGTLTVRTYSRQLTGVGANISGHHAESFRVGHQIVVAEIDDTGEGIPEDKLPKIFEPFYTTKPTGKGTGLGLSVVKTIMDLHGGTIDVFNRSDETGVRVTLMFRPSGAPPPGELTT